MPPRIHYPASFGFDGESSLRSASLPLLISSNFSPISSSLSLAIWRCPCDHVRQSSHTPHDCHRLARHRPSRLEVHHPHARALSGFHGRGRSDSGPWHRREHRNILPPRPGFVAATPRQRSATTRPAHHERTPLRQQLGRQCNLPSHVPRLSGSQRSVLGNVLPLSHLRESFLWPPDRTRRCGIGVWHLLLCSRRRPCPGTHTHARGRSRPKRSSLRCPQLQLLEDTFCRRSPNRRQDVEFE